jgi:hypothetical protein
MLRNPRWRAVAIVAGVVFVLVMFYETFLTYPDAPPPMTQAPILFKGGHVVNHHVNTKSWSLDYDSAQMTQDQSSGTIDGIHNGIIFRKGKPYLKISAQQASVNTLTLDFTATGLVHVEELGAKEPVSFDTDLIVWSNALHDLTMSHPSYFHTGDQTLKVEDVTVNLETKKYHIGKIDGSVDYNR